MPPKENPKRSRFVSLFLRAALVQREKCLPQWETEEGDMLLLQPNQ